MKFGRLLVRVIVGGLFIGHGTQKLLGWFGGPGQAGSEQMMHSIGMRPGRRNALAAGITETTGGALLTAGLATPLAAAGLIGVMVTAVRKVHLRNGLWNSRGGYEYNLVLIAILLSLADGGPGELSADRVLGIQRTGPAWALAALGLGAAASALAVELGRRPVADAASQPGEEAVERAASAAPSAQAAAPQPGRPAEPARH
jgi:putative oxidoreductase